MAEQLNSRPDTRMRKSGCGCGGGRKRQVVSGQKETSAAGVSVVADVAKVEDAVVEVDGANGTVRADGAKVEDAVVVAEVVNGTVGAAESAEAFRPTRVQAGTKPLLNKAEPRRNGMRKKNKRP